MGVTVAGLAALAVAIIAAVFVVTRFVFSQNLAVIVAVGLSLGVAVLWYLLPLRARWRSR